MVSNFIILLSFRIFVFKSAKNLLTIEYLKSLNTFMLRCHTDGLSYSYSKFLKVATEVLKFSRVLNV